MTPTYLITVINCMWMGGKERGILSSYCSCIVVLLSYRYFLLFLCICFDAGMVVWCICSTEVTGNKNLYRCFVRWTNKIKQKNTLISITTVFNYVRCVRCAIKVPYTRHLKRDHRERCAVSIFCGNNSPNFFAIWVTYDWNTPKIRTSCMCDFAACVY